MINTGTAVHNNSGRMQIGTRTVSSAVCFCML